MRLEPYLDINAVQVDVHPKLVRLLARGRLLQIRLPEEVCSDMAIAQRSKASGKLVITMPHGNQLGGNQRGSKELGGKARKGRIESRLRGLVE